ncbi:hypothetical protein CAPTEDRAFT_219025 [Capitella teleta]|uniref:Peptidase metallopeptidase domain-containing protein n=1 Tax=Capitella teleta TaxID=283909 RepID=R7TD51_CAPTE|nr:hypothetical protein CAPTEDRAFT_219025 [Capitella teleta]|eukprot:ELT91654.1 hypothetical protein CAPTEDRAFT_219025 [Capitella teleta]
MAAYDRIFTLLLLLAVCCHGNGQRSTGRRNRNGATSSNRRANKQMGANPKDMGPDQFLEKFGYLKELPSGVQRSEESRREAIKHFQRMAHLEETGVLDAPTRRQMKQPRCGMPDMMPTQAEVPPGVSFDPGMNPQNYYVPGYKWKKQALTWKAHNYSPDLDSGSQRRAFHKAFQYWSDVTPLTFAETGASEADIDIQFARGQHSDGPGNAFDGPGGTLAHAFFPENGDTHFDEDEDWTQNTETGTNLEIVAAHEFGHALGLGHSNVRGALMAPYYQGYDPNFSLHDDDVRAIQSLYGSNQPAAPTLTTTRKPSTRRTPRPGSPTTTPRPGKKPDSCTAKFDVIFQAHDYGIYAFKAQWIWRLNDWAVDEGYPKLSRKVYQNPPLNIGAAVYSWKTRYTYFFKGTKVWRYYGFERIERKVITKTSFPAAQAAFMDRHGKIYLLKGAEYWEFSEETMNVVSADSQPIAAKWPGIPPNIEAVVRLNDGYIYFFKGARYRKFDEYYNRVVSGYPKDKAGPWMGPTCGGEYVPK